PRPDADAAASAADPARGARGPPHRELEGGQAHREHRLRQRRLLAAAGLGPQRHAWRSTLRNARGSRSAGGARRPRPGSRPALPQRSDPWTAALPGPDPGQYPARSNARSFRKADPPVRRAPGFTLLEVVIAVGITAMMGALIAAAFQS